MKGLNNYRVSVCHVQCLEAHHSICVVDTENLYKPTYTDQQVELSCHPYLIPRISTLIILETYSFGVAM